ncbi:MAG: hypothetical protein EAZ53_16345 [Bacteroidetes bacterium]|nr:MAG: hypothetical protein EAZ53_16345 [Bacteroidota bacterium]
MNFELDFSQLNLVSDPDKITQIEIRSVIEDEDSRFEWMEGFPINEAYHTVCGYSNKKRILLIASNIPSSKRVILEVKVASKGEIKSYYCKK